MRLTIANLMKYSNIREFLIPIVEKWDDKSEAKKAPTQKPKRMSKEIKQLIHTLEEENIARLIDVSLLDKDEILFNKLVKMQKTKRGKQK